MSLQPWQKRRRDYLAKKSFPVDKYPPAPRKPVMREQVLEPALNPPMHGRKCFICDATGDCEHREPALMEAEASALAQARQRLKTGSGT